MPKQPSKRARYPKGASPTPTPNSQGADEVPAAVNVAAEPLQAADRLETTDKQRLLRSPLLPEQLNFLPPSLLVRVLALILLVLSFLGTLIVANPLDWGKAGIFSLCMVVVAVAFWWSTRRFPPANPLVSYCALAVEIGATLTGLLVLGFNTPLYFSTLLLYLILGHIHAVFSLRPAFIISGLWWLVVVVLLAIASTDNSWVAKAFILILTFSTVSLVVRFFIRESQQRHLLAEALTELRISEERYRQLTNQSLDAIYILDKDGRFNFLNTRATELTGFYGPEVVGRHISEVLQPDNLPVINRALQESLKEAETNRKTKDLKFYPLTVNRKDGSRRLVEVSVAPVLDKQGQLNGWIGIARDVTERTRMREQTDRRNRDLAALNAVISAAGKTLDLDRLLEDVVTTLVKVLRADVAGITLIEDENRLLKVAAYRDRETTSRNYIKPGQEEAEGLQRLIASGQTTLAIKDLAASGQAAKVGYSAEELGLKSFAAALVRSREETLGLVCLLSKDKNAFQQDDLDLLASIGQSLAVAIENARLYGTSRSQVREMTALAEIARAINLSESLRQTLTNIATSISQTLGYKGCSIFLIEPEQLYIHTYGGYGLPSGFVERLNQLAHDTSLSREELRQLPVFQAMQADRPRVYPVRLIEGKLAEATRVPVSQGWQSSLAVPLIIQGRHAGVISCYGDTGNVAESELRLMATIANQTSLAVQNANLYREQQRRADQLRAVSEIGRQIGSILSVDELLPYITRLLQQTFDYYLVGIYLVDQDNPTQLILRASHGWGSQASFIGEGFDLTETHERGLVPWVAQQGQALIIPDVNAEPRYRDYHETGMVRSELVVPIKSGQQISGVIDLASTLPNGFDEVDLATMQVLAEQVGIALENARLYTEVNRVVVQLTRTNLELEEATRHKSEFLANMSHELRTPLNAIIGFSEVMMDQLFGELNERQKRYVMNILTSGRHLLSLVNDVLDLSKVEAGHMELLLDDIAPADAILDVEAILSVNATKKNLAFENSFESDEITVRADRSKFKQILYNLLSNAVKFTPEKGRITVGTYLHREDNKDFLATWVKDTGIGIRKEEQQGIFEEFKQVDSSYARQHQGTGLGLALTKRLIELHGGRIWVESEPGVGSLFTFLLPLHPVLPVGGTISAIREASEDEVMGFQANLPPARLLMTRPQPEEMPVPVPAGPPGPLVLVVEDDDRAAEILGLYLHEGGYQTVRATSGEVAKRVLERYRVALITLDVILPGKSGWEVLDELKQAEAARNIPVIVVTIANDVQAVEKGAFGFVSKPLIKDHFLALVEKAVAHSTSTTPR